MPNTGPSSPRGGRPYLYIAVGVLTAEDGRVLIAKRLPGKPGAGKWEFPGGKREKGESVGAALARELDEELGVRVRGTRPLLRFGHDYSDRRVLLDIHRVTAWDGEPHGREGQELAWCRPDDLFDYDLLEANAPVVAALRLPDRYLITPEPGDDPEAFLSAVEQAVTDGIRLLRLRAWTLGDEDYERLAQSLQARIVPRGGTLLLDRDAAMVERVGAAGLHLPARALDTIARRPLPADRWFALSCHDRGELERAQSLGADFATLSPVAATPSHPDAVALGWPGFATAREGVPLPVYALGGLDQADIESACMNGAQGVAAVRAFFSGLP